MTKQPSVQAEYVFRGVEHGVRISTDETLLEVEVEDIHTSDQWRGEFDTAFIEDLTHKTGNFKQFSIFCSMLESALMQSSESVTLDLLTYADLEQLRNRKMGSGIWHVPTTKSAALNSKRYLILIYSVEFDRVERLAEEKQELEMTMLQLQEEAKLSHKSGALKEVRILKKIVKNLEAELMKERSKYQRTTNKRMQEYQQMAEELEELKVSERTLRARVKGLTNELALYKRGRITPVGPSPQNHTSSAHRVSRSQNSSAAGDERRATSRERSGSRERSASWSATREHLVDREGRSGSRSCAAHLTPSPSGTRLSRFDPTAYVKDKERKQKEAEMKNIRRIRRDMSSSPASDRGRLPSRVSRRHTGRNLQGVSSSVESFRSRPSSVSSLSDLEGYHEPIPTSGDKKKVRRRHKPLGSSSWNGFSLKPREKPANRKYLASTPTSGKNGDKENLFDPSTDLSEIDSRLHALQEYMKNLDTRI
uniref:Centrosomal protein CCDC61 n=1 Tax=Geotrypetes seraphini TaxID=260995 RepID=A0A6P8S2T0_GEOSA|nr:coiled-coil domain-containing protein 61 isoform X4 [Geotrypetes seraphini]